MNPSKRLVAIACIFLLCTPALEARVPQEADPENILKHGEALYRDGRFDEAIEALHQAIELLTPTSEQQKKRTRLADAYFSLGLAQYTLGDYSAAAKSFEHGFTLEPDRTLDPETFPLELVTLFASGRHQAAPAPIVGAGETSIFSENGLEVPTGAKVRVHLGGEGSGVQGYLVSLDERLLVMTTPDQQRLRFPSNLIEKFELSKGRKNNALMGLVLGAVAGAAIGAIEKVDADCEGDDCYTRAENVGYGALGMGLVGALVGACVRTDQWIEVPMERVGIRVTSNGLDGVGFLVRWSY